MRPRGESVSWDASIPDVPSASSGLRSEGVEPYDTTIPEVDMLLKTLADDTGLLLGSSSLLDGGSEAEAAAAALAAAATLTMGAADVAIKVEALGPIICPKEGTFYIYVLHAGRHVFLSSRFSKMLKDLKATAAAAPPTVSKLATFFHKLATLGRGRADVAGRRVVLIQEGVDASLKDALDVVGRIGADGVVDAAAAADASSTEAGDEASTHSADDAGEGAAAGKATVSPAGSASRRARLPTPQCLQFLKAIFPSTPLALARSQDCAIRIIDKLGRWTAFLNGVAEGFEQQPAELRRIAKAWEPGEMPHLKVLDKLRKWCEEYETLAQNAADATAAYRARDAVVGGVRLDLVMARDTIDDARIRVIQHGQRGHRRSPTESLTKLVHGIKHLLLVLDERRRQMWQALTRLLMAAASAKQLRSLDAAMKVATCAVDRVLEKTVKSVPSKREYFTVPSAMAAVALDGGDDAAGPVEAPRDIVGKGVPSLASLADAGLAADATAAAGVEALSKLTDSRIHYITAGGNAEHDVGAESTYGSDTEAEEGYRPRGRSLRRAHSSTTRAKERDRAERKGDGGAAVADAGDETVREMRDVVADDAAAGRDIEACDADDEGDAASVGSDAEGDDPMETIIAHQVLARLRSGHGLQQAKPTDTHVLNMEHAIALRDALAALLDATASVERRRERSRARSRVNRLTDRRGLAAANDGDVAPGALDDAKHALQAKEAFIDAVEWIEVAITSAVEDVYELARDLESWHSEKNSRRREDTSAMHADVDLERCRARNAAEAARMGAAESKAIDISAPHAGVGVGVDVGGGGGGVASSAPAGRSFVGGSRWRARGDDAGAPTIPPSRRTHRASGSAALVASTVPGDLIARAAASPDDSGGVDGLRADGFAEVEGDAVADDDDGGRAAAAAAAVGRRDDGSRRDLAAEAARRVVAGDVAGGDGGFDPELFVLEAGYGVGHGDDDADSSDDGLVVDAGASAGHGGAVSCSWPPAQLY